MGGIFTHLNAAASGLSIYSVAFCLLAQRCFPICTGLYYQTHTSSVNVRHFPAQRKAPRRDPTSSAVLFF